MTRHIFRPARGIVAHTYDVFTDTGAHVGTIGRSQHGWHYAPAATRNAAPLTAATFQALRARMRDQLAREVSRS